MPQKYLKYIPQKAETPPIYLLIKHSHSSGSKYFSRCLFMMFALVWMHFEVNYHISKPFWFSNIKRKWNGATFFGPLVFDNDFNDILITLSTRIVCPFFPFTRKRATQWLVGFNLEKCIVLRWLWQKGSEEVLHLEWQLLWQPTERP